ncbi:MAG: alpha/beta hydrolase [Pseudomonadales bacterium]|nr:alpha/beta hydrolase [Pseudomonadales bacterium]
MSSSNIPVSDDQFPSTTITFDAYNGMKIVADVWGNPDDRPILFAHGGGQTRHAWRGSAKTIAQKGWYSIAIDMRGHGDSDWDKNGDYQMGSFAKDIIKISKQLKKKPVLVGASLGGLSGILAESDSNESIFSALILVDITPKMDQKGVTKIVSFMNDKLEEGFGSIEEAADAIARYNPTRARPKNNDGLAKNLRLHDDGRYRWHWDPKFMMGNKRPRSDNYADRIIGATESLTLPTLLVRGQMSDLVTEEHAQDFLRMVPHAKYTNVKDAGHMIAGDKNDVFTAAVIDFLEA